MIDWPEPWVLPDGYDRHDPSPGAQRALLADWVGGVDRARAPWSDVVVDLIAAGRADVASSRLFEGHVDACRILAQAGATPAPGLYGVWASRSQATGIRATTRPDGRHRLDGELRFASGVGVIDRALVPVWPSPDHHLLVDLDVGGLEAEPGSWSTTAMAASRSSSVRIAGREVAAEAIVGPPDFYLERPGFLPGGLGPAACWLGAALRVDDLIERRLRGERAESVAVRLGRARLALTAAGAVVRTAARRLDADPALAGGTPVGADAVAAERRWRIPAEARAIVAAAVDVMLDAARRIGGPAGLAHDRELGAAIDDLQLYVLQHRAEPDLARLGRC